MNRFLPAALFAACSTAGAAETSATASAGNLVQVLVGLVIVLALMAGAAWAIKRFGLARSVMGTTVKIIGGVSVGSRERIIVVEVADQWIVVGVAPGRISALSTMPRQETGSAQLGTPLETAPAGKNFSAWLKQTIERRNGNQP